MADDDNKILEDAKKLPLAERVAHGNWKVRSAAFEDIKKSCDQLFTDGDAVLDQHAPLFPKAVTETNAATLDKVLEALVAFQTRATEQQASRIADRTCSNIVAKCLTARPATLNKVADVVLNFIEAEQGAVVVDNLVQGFTHKVPKAVVAAVELVHKALCAFGAKALPVQPLFKTLQPLFESKDSKVRDLAKQIVVELARWLGAPMVRASLFDKMRDAIKDDIEKLLANAPEGRPQAQRFTRKEQIRQQQAVASSADAEEGAAAGPAAAAAEPEHEMADAYEFVDPKDILSELKKDFWEGLGAAKWSERKAALTQLKDLAAAPKLANGDYGDVNRELKKIITKDSHVAVVAEAIACTGNLAQGLRKEYSGPARTLASVLLEKYKDKNTGVVKATTEALTNMHKHCWPLLDVAEDFTAALGHQHPKVKELALQWLVDSVNARETKATVPKLAPALLPAIAKCAEDAVPGIREGGFTLMVSFAVKVGNPAILDKYTSKLDEGKKKKLEEMIGEARKGMAGARAAPAAATAPAASSSSSSSSSRPATAPAGRSKPRPSGDDDAGPPAKAAPAKAPSRSGAPRPQTAASKAGGGAAAAVPDTDDEVALSSGQMGKTEAVEKLKELLGDELVAQLQDAAWKTRLEAMEALLERAKAPELAASGCALAQAIAHVPGWDEKNFQVLSKQFELVALMAQRCSSFSKREGLVGIIGCIEKLSDIKLKGPANNTLMAIAEACGPQFVLNLLHKKATGHKNPKVTSEAINTMSQAIQDFGLQSLNVKSLLDWMKEDLGNSNPGVRNAAVQLLGIMHSFVGPSLGDLIRNDIKPALMTTVEAEFAKNPKDASFTPARTSRVTAKGAAGSGAAGSGAAGPSSKAAGRGGKAAAVVASAAFDADDLLPREDISGSITSKLISELGSANWKERKAAMDEVEGFISAAGNRIQPSTGDLIHSLKPRMVDANRNLTVQALQLVGKLARAMGKAIAREARPILSPSVKNLSDPKTQVRAAVTEMLSAWASVAPVDTLFNEVAEAITVPKCSNDGKKDGMNWVAATIRDGKGLDCLPEAVRCAAVCSGDKAVDVREASTSLMTTLIEVCGAAEVGAASQQLEGASKKAAAELISKITGLAPAAAGPPLATRPTSSTGSAAAAGKAGLLRTSTSGSIKPAAAGKAAALNTKSTMRASTSILTRQSSSSGVAPGAGPDGPLLGMDNKKEDRTKKGKYKGTKFEIRPEEPQELDALFAPIAAPAFKALLFGKDFKKHCEAADVLAKQADTHLEEITACCDLIFRWSVLRINEGNTQTLMSVLNLLKVVLDLLAQSGYKMSEYEGKLLLPGVVEKCGQSQDKLKADFKELMRKCCTLMPAPKVLAYIKDGLDSKNNRTRVACAEEIAAMVDREGQKVYSKQADMWPCMAKLTSERDAALRAAVLAALEVLYAFEGEAARNMLGKLSDQQRTIVEERFKSCDKDLARKGLRPGHRGPAAMTATASAPVAEAAGERSRPGSAASWGTSRQASNTSMRASASAAPSEESIGVATSLNPLVNERAAMAPAHAYTAAPGYQAAPAYAAPAAAAAYMQPAAAMPTSLSRPGTAPGSAAQSFAALATTPPNMAPGGTLRQSLQTAIPSVAAIRKESRQAVEEDYRRCLVRLRGQDMTEAVEVMKMICYELTETKPPHPLVMDVFVSHADDLLRTLAFRADIVFSQASDAQRNKQDPNQRACKYALNTLMACCSIPVITMRLSQTTLQELVGILLMVLIDGGIQAMPQGQAMLTAINVLMLRILENSNKNSAFGSLLQHLLQCPQRVMSVSEGQDQRWFDLVVKCLIKVTKTLPTTLPEIDVPRLLLSIHKFFEALGAEEVSRRHNTDDKPYRMVKTILHEVVKHCGPDTIQLVPKEIKQDGMAKSVIVVYIENYLQTHTAMRQMQGGTQPAQQTQQQQQMLQAQQQQQMQQQQMRMSQQAGALSRYPNSSAAPGASSMPDAQPHNDEPYERSLLAQLFKRIGDKQDSDAALQDLYNFTLQNPHINLDHYLQTSSSAFKVYIQKGLAKIQQRQAQHSGADVGTIAAVRGGQYQGGPVAMEVDYQAQGSYRQEGPVERVDSGDSALQGSTFTNISGFSKLTVESMRERVRSSNSSMVGDNAQAAPPNAQLVSGLASLQERFRRLQEDKSRPGSAAAGGEQGLD